MSLLLVLLIAAVFLLASKRRNGPEQLERWRVVAVLTGVCWPYSEIVLQLLGAGPYWQAWHGLFWSLPLVPLFACLLAGGLSVWLRQPWRQVLVPVAAGMLLTVLLGALTHNGVRPLAGLADLWVALGWVHPWDPVLAGLALFGLIMCVLFSAYNRDMARLTLLCMAVYVGGLGVLAWQARHVALSYAQTLKLAPVTLISVQPGGGSPLNWTLLVAEANGRLHLSRVNLRNSSAVDAAQSEQANSFLPANMAVWSVVPRDGGGTEEDKRRARLAWYAWQDSPFARYGRFAALLRFVPAPDAVPHHAKDKPAATCARFRDVRLRQETPLRDFIICPRTGPGGGVLRARMYVGKEQHATEVVPLFFAR